MNTRVKESFHINKGFSKTNVENSNFKIRKCPVCKTYPMLPMIERRKNFDFCHPRCWNIALNAVVLDLEWIIKGIFGVSEVDI